MTPTGAPLLQELEKAYSPKEEMPLGAYAVTTVIYNALLLAALRFKRERLARSPMDLLLAGIATHKLSRIITKDAVTSFLRAPLMRYQESLGYGELAETPRRHGSLLVLAELVNCSYCMSSWVGLGFLWGFELFPRQARRLAGLFATIALSDFLHVAYEEKRSRENVLTLQEEKLSRGQGTP